MRALIRTSLQLSILLLVPALLSAQADTALKQESPGLLAQAKISVDSARAIARHRIPGGVIQSSELEREGGKLVYSFDLKVAGKKGTEEVLVDAITGRIVGVEHENAAAEAAEERADSAKKP
jgi:uncharacterized membrane protein YkoI